MRKPPLLKTVLPPSSSSPSSFYYLIASPLSPVSVFFGVRPPPPATVPRLHKYPRDRPASIKNFRLNLDQSKFFLPRISTNQKYFLTPIIFKIFQRHKFSSKNFSEIFPENFSRPKKIPTANPSPPSPKSRNPPLKQPSPKTTFFRNRQPPPNPGVHQPPFPNEAQNEPRLASGMK